MTCTTQGSRIWAPTGPTIALHLCRPSSILDRRWLIRATWTHSLLPANLSQENNAEPMRNILYLTIFCFAAFQFSTALDRQPNSDYHARREKLAAKLEGGFALVFAPPEAEGPNDLYGYRPDDNFYYLTGWTEPGAALLIVSAEEAQGNIPARTYAEILFLPNRNYSQERWTGRKLGPDDPNAIQITSVDRGDALDNLRTGLVQLLPASPPPRHARIDTDVPSSRAKSNPT